MPGPSDFNYDFHVTSDESVAPIEYNFRSAQELAGRGEAWAARPGEQSGLSFAPAQVRTLGGGRAGL